jgi:hypothetical protein
VNGLLRPLRRCAAQAVPAGGDWTLGAPGLLREPVLDHDERRSGKSSPSSRLAFARQCPSPTCARCWLPTHGFQERSEIGWRRARTLPAHDAHATPPQAFPPDNPRTEAAAVHLTPGKVKAVRAAFNVGVKPSQIARQFGLSQSDVWAAAGPAWRRPPAPVAIDANDFLWQWGSSADYDPAPGLEKLQAWVLAINSADDERDPPETGIEAKAMKRVKNGKLYLIPAGDQTSGHGTTGNARFYSQQLQEFLQLVPRRAM